MFVLRPSSPIRAAAVAPDLDAPPLADDEHYVDKGLPVPETYDVDIVRAMLQDPFRIFIYWELRDATVSALTRYFTPEEVESFTVTLKLIELSGGHEAYFDVWRRGRYWMMVFPDRDYEFEIGLRSPLHGYIPVVRSNRVHTPRGTVSPVPPVEEEFRMTPSEFREVIEVSGFAPEQAVSLSVAALPGHSDIEPDWLSQAVARLPEGVRTAVRLAVAGGPLTREQIEQIPEPLRSELLKMFMQAGGDMAAVSLMHYLPELLRETLEDEYDIVGDPLHPIHIAPRFFQSGSENINWPGGELRWPGLPRRPSSWDLRR